jgi:hypothetical protein
MAAIAALDKIYPLKTKRLVDDSSDSNSINPLTNFSGTQRSASKACSSKFQAFLKTKKVKLFRVIVSTDKTEFVVTNHLTQDSIDAQASSPLSVESGAGERNHTTFALLVWARLKQIADASGTTIYQLKSGLLSNYLMEHLKSPTIAMKLSHACSYN